MISTTHQLYRFASAFDAVIVDEVDAFPYTFDETLQRAVQKAAKDRCARIYLTATPGETWQLECKAGKRPFVTILTSLPPQAPPRSYIQMGRQLAEKV